MALTAERPAASVQASLPPKPEVCGNCRAEGDSIYWNATGGWACRSCGACDYEEAAE